MPQAKLARQNKKIKPVVRDTNEETEDLLSIPVAKIKKVAEVDLHDDIIGVVEEKPEVDPLLAEEETDESVAEESLDEEEINPFGDKWEI